MCAERINNPWTDEVKEAARDYYIAGFNRAEIADRLQKQFGIAFSPRACQQAIYRNFPEVVAAKVTGRGEVREDLKGKATRLVAQGYAPAEAASKLGVGAHRIYAWVGREARPARMIQFGINTWLEDQERSEVPEDPIVDHGSLLIELEHGDCKWPIGKDSDGQWRFCACKSVRLGHEELYGPYCEVHAAMSTKRSRRKVVSIPITVHDESGVPVPVNRGEAKNNNEPRVAA